MVSTTIDEETGEEKKRMINRMRWKGYGPASIMFSDEHVKKKNSVILKLSIDFDSFRYQQNRLKLFRREGIKSTRAC